MFNFLKKKEEPFKLVACVDGTCMNIEEVKDEVFSKRMMGDGFAIVPRSNTVVSPINGSVEVAFHTGHAFGLKTTNGVEVLVHIGIDTVNLNGEGFKTLVKQGSKVKAGQSLVELNLDLIKEKGYDPTIMIIFTAGYDQPINLEYNQEVSLNQILIG